MSKDHDQQQGQYPPPQWDSQTSRGPYPATPQSGPGYLVSDPYIILPRLYSESWLLILFHAGSTHLPSLPPTITLRTRRDGHSTSTAVAATARSLPPSTLRHVPGTSAACTLSAQSSRPPPRSSTRPDELQSTGATATHSNSLPVL